MGRRGAERPGLGDWMVLGAAIVLSATGIFADEAGRMQAAHLLSQTLLRPFRLVIGYASCSSDVAGETRKLRKEMADLTLDRVRLEELERENGRLRNQLGFAQRDARLLRPALVVGRAPDRFGEILSISRPEGVLVLPGKTVVGTKGLVGTVLDADAREARVRTVRNGALRVSAMLERSRYVGLVRWRPVERVAMLEGVPLQVNVAVGEAVLTTGYGHIFPKGLPVGTVVGIADDSTALARNIRIRFDENLDRLEEVFVIED
ncbi:MAG: rod shape-determining protein MreC [Candidatus Eisenbacteria bacterium]|nr:rod shape-determining protein MreC [Candidatus Eisenbacteria bacterium]